jgi:hypothetical protein
MVDTTFQLKHPRAKPHTSLGQKKKKKILNPGKKKISKLLFLFIYLLLQDLISCFGLSKMIKRKKKIHVSFIFILLST